MSAHTRKRQILSARICIAIAAILLAVPTDAGSLPAEICPSGSKKETFGQPVGIFDDVGSDYSILQTVLQTSGGGRRRRVPAAQTVSSARGKARPPMSFVRASPKADVSNEVEGTSTGGLRSFLPSLKLVLLVFMVLQNSTTVLVGRHTRNLSLKKDLYVVADIVMVCEALKLLLSCILEYKATDGKLIESIRENILSSPQESVRILVPSLLYLVQNTLLYVALSNLSAPLFQVTYQMKLLTTAVASVFFLNRTYDVKQWICLACLSLGVAAVVLAERVPVIKETVTTAVSEHHHVQSMSLGLVAVGTACVASALAGVSLEKILKASPVSKTDDEKDRPPVSLWLRNIQMAFFSLCIAVVRNHFSRGEDSAKPFMHGFTGWVYLLVALQAGGGLLVAAVMKYADNVLKGLATGVSVVVSSAGSAYFFGTPINDQFVVGASVILISVYLFSNDLPFTSKDAGSKITK